MKKQSPSTSVGFAVLLVLVPLPLSALMAGTADLSTGKSPDGKFTVRINSEGEFPLLEVVDTSTHRITGSTATSGFGQYPAIAEESANKISWSPDSKHFAWVSRNSKRTTVLKIFSVTTTGIEEIHVPSVTNRALVLVKAPEINRYSNEVAKSWTDNNTLVVEASGDVPGKAAIPNIYQAEFTYDIAGKKISGEKGISLKPAEG